MIVLGEEELGRRQDLRRDLAVPRRCKPLLIGSLRRLGRLLLSIGERVDAGAVLRADIVPLTHALSRIVVLPEGLEERVVRDHLRIEHDEHNLVVSGLSGANLFVGRIGREAAGIANSSRPDTGADLPELALSTPEAADSEHRGLEAFRIWSLDRPAEDEVLFSRRKRRRPALERGLGSRHFGLLSGEQHFYTHWFVGHDSIRMRPAEVAEL